MRNCVTLHISVGTADCLAVVLGTSQHFRLGPQADYEMEQATFHSVSKLHGSGSLRRSGDAVTWRHSGAPDGVLVGQPQADA